MCPAMLLAIVSGCILTLVVTSVHSRPTDEHLEDIIDSKAQKLVAEAQTPDGLHSRVQMLEGLAVELEHAVEGDDKRAEQFQSELATLVDLPGLIAGSASTANGAIDKRHRIGRPANRQDEFYRHLVDRLKTQSQGLLVALSKPEQTPHVVSAPRVFGRNQMADFKAIGLRHADFMGRARKNPPPGGFGQLVREAPIVNVKTLTQVEDKKLIMMKNLHQKLNWVKHLYVPLVFLKNMPIIGDEFEKYIALGGPIMNVVTGLSYGIQVLLHHWEKKHAPVKVASSSALALSSAEQLPAEVVGAQEDAGALLSEATLKALKSTTSLMLNRFDVNCRLADGQQNELLHRVLGFIVGELAKRMTIGALRG